jgi:hypothetical protein
METGQQRTRTCWVAWVDNDDHLGGLWPLQLLL